MQHLSLVNLDAVSLNSLLLTLLLFGTPRPVAQTSQDLTFPRFDGYAGWRGGHAVYDELDDEQPHDGIDDEQPRGSSEHAAK